MNALIYLWVVAEPEPMSSLDIPQHLFVVEVFFLELDEDVVAKRDRSIDVIGGVLFFRLSSFDVPQV